MRAETFLKEVLAYPVMLALKERERLLGTLVDVYAEQGYEASEVDWSGAGGAIFAGAFAEMLSAEEEAVVAAINETLAKIAAAVSGARHGSSESTATPPSSIVAALGGAEMVTRSEILAGRSSGYRSSCRASPTW